MNKKNAITLLLLLLLSLRVSAQKWDELSKTPQMGWSSWNKFQGNIDEDIIKSIADAMVSSGLRDAGYIYVNIDDCWHGKRDSNGFIQADPKHFPHGIKALADYIHARGLKLGIYSDAGSETCAGRPGSLGHEYQDALQYARWDIDYLKYDWCNTTNINARGAYQLMSDALRAAGRPIFFSMCEWGDNNPWRWARDIGNSWRIGPDIWCSFDSTRVFPTYVQYSVLDCINKNDSLRSYAGPGHWNDPDMLEVGNGLTVNQDRAHFTMWCMMASPLILGNDVRSEMGNIPNSIQSAGYENQTTHVDRLFARLLLVSEFMGQQNRIGTADCIVIGGTLASAIKKNSQYIISPTANTLVQQPELHYTGTLYGTMNVYKNPKIDFNDPRVLLIRRGDTTDTGAKFFAYDLAASRQTIAEGTMAEKIRVWSRFQIADIGFHPELNYYTFVAINEYGWA